MDSLDNTKVSKKAYQAAIVATLINLCSGFQYCWSLLGKDIIAQYGWTATQASLPYSVLTIVTSLWATVAGRIGEYLAPKYSTMLGGLAMGFGLIISSRTQSPIVMVFSVGGLLGIASTSITNATTPCAQKWWPESKKGLITGIVTMGVAFSSLYMSPIVNALLERQGISGTFLTLGIAALVLICGLSFFLPTPPVVLEDRRKRKAAKAAGLTLEEYLEKNPDETSATAKFDEDDALSIYQNKVDPNQALKTKELYLLCAIYFVGMLAGQLLISQVANICVVQANWQDGYIAVMALSVGNGLARLISGGLADRIGVFNTFKLAFGIQAVNLLLFSFYRTPATLVIGSIILGACYGACVPLILTATAQVYGRRYAASIYGYVAIMFGIAGFVGPFLAAKILDITGAYTWAYIIIAIISVIGIFFASQIRDLKQEAKKA